MDPKVHLKNISKRFGTLSALKSVDLKVEKGTLHALVGENGAGKTTLMRILYGCSIQCEGSIFIDKEECHFKNSSEAIHKHIGMVSQHYSIIPELTCLENLMLGSEPSVFLKKKELIQLAQSLAKQMGFEFDWNVAASVLSPAGAQKLEILKLLWRKAEVMILDEPTAMLSPTDSESLYLSLKKLAEKGATVIVVTHRITEVLNYCDRVTVLRNGSKITDKDVKDTNSHELAELIVGHTIQTHEHRDIPLGDIVLNVKNLVVHGIRGDEALKEISFNIRSGEILGLAGVDGNGQRELFQVLTGIISAHKGSIEFMGMNMSNLTPAERIVFGLRSIPEDRHSEAIVSEWKLLENASLGFQQMKMLKTGFWINNDERKKLTHNITQMFKTKHSGFNAEIGSLSGGNQQRFVAARALQYNPKLIIAFQPSRGLDIDGSANVYEAIREACSNGAAALVVSFDLDELLQECDRLIAINHGKLFAPSKGCEKDRMTIGKLMVGVI